MTDPIRVGVVGVGAIGRHHARIYAETPLAELAGVFDVDQQRAEAVASRHGTSAVATLEELLDRVDAVSVAVPTLLHRELGTKCLGAGCHVLMEKPIAHDLAAADELVAAATERGLVLQVGHVERFNPAVEALVGRVVSPRFIEVHRLGSFAPRSLEVDVVLDLMIHDIDVMHALVSADVEEVRAVGVPVLSTEVDIANARLQLSDGCVVNMTASRVSMSKVRKLRVFQPEAYFSVDYSAQQVACFRLQRDGQQRTSIMAEPITVASAEPLTGQLLDFLRCCREGSRARVDGAAGRLALQTALRIRAAIDDALGSVVLPA